MIYFVVYTTMKERKGQEEKDMTYKAMADKVIENRKKLLTTRDTEEKRRLIIESHELMTEMDRRWQAVEKKIIRRKTS